VETLIKRWRKYPPPPKKKKKEEGESGVNDFQNRSREVKQQKGGEAVQGGLKGESVF